MARLAQAVLRAERARLVALSITFVGPAGIRALNRRHRRHNRVTDVIAFSLGGTAGDVYVCPSVAALQARHVGVPVREELRRLIVHGVLHVLGYDHPAGAERLASPMWRRQERLLARYGALAR